MKIAQPSDLIFVDADEDIEVEEVEKKLLDETLSLLSADGLRNRIASGNVESDDLHGQAVFEFNSRIRAGYKGKMANGNDPFRMISKQLNGSLSAKQLRRLSDRHRLILAFEALGLSRPSLTVSHYDSVKKLSSTMDKYRVLKLAEDNKWSNAKLIKYVSEFTGGKPSKSRKDAVVENLDVSIRRLGKVVEIFSEKSHSKKASAGIGVRLREIREKVDEISRIYESQTTI